MKSKKPDTAKNYINEIIRITYKCNWSCKFCNVLKTNNFWEKDISDKEIIYKILNLTKKYTLEQRWNLILSLSWWEPTLHKNLLFFIKLAKSIWVWIVEIQTNWTILFRNKEYILELIESWLDSIFLAQHSWNKDINKQLWNFYNTEDFINWTKYILENNLHQKIWIFLNIVVTKINIFWIYEYINHLLEIWFIKIIPALETNDNFTNAHKISFWFVQPNWYAKLNKEEVLLKFVPDEVREIDRIINLCKENNIFPDFHFTSPPLCILNYPEFNLEFSRLKNLEKDIKDWDINESNLESYKLLWKEKIKFKECDNCNNNKYCLWFYKNWIEFVWEDYLKEKINTFIK